MNRVERAPVQATATSSTTTISSNEVQLILSRKDANPTKTICQGQAWSISANITLPPGKHELTIEIFAPRKEFDYIGYIQYFGISSTDKTIISYTTNEKKEYFVNQKVSLLFI
ncbi:unnamed protein product [Trichobilharzia regenti]|nr:unnamed protein product [Trichobilharzia regenti]